MFWLQEHVKYDAAPFYRYFREHLLNLVPPAPRHFFLRLLAEHGMLQRVYSGDSVSSTRRMGFEEDEQSRGFLTPNRLPMTSVRAEWRRNSGWRGS